MLRYALDPTAPPCRPRLIANDGFEIAGLSQGGMAGLDCLFQGEMRLAVWFRGRCPRLLWPGPFRLWLKRHVSSGPVAALYTSMERYRELYIKVGAEHTAQFVANLDAALSSGWTRARE